MKSTQLNNNGTTFAYLLMEMGIALQTFEFVGFGALAIAFIQDA